MSERAKRERSPWKFAPPDATTLLVFATTGTQFAIQAWLSYRFAKDVWGIPQPLCIAIIAALDLFAITYMVFTYLLRRAKWTVKLYVWVIFAAAVGAQLFAAELYGAHRHWSLELRIFSAIPALALAASLHGYIVVRNHVRDRRDVHLPPSPQREHKTPPPTADKPKPQAAPPAPPADKPAASKPPIERPRPATGDQQPGKRIPDEVKRDTIRRYQAGEKAVDLAKELGATPKSIQNWAKDPRLNPPPVPPVPPVEPPPHINGFDPTKVQVS